MLRSVAQEKLLFFSFPQTNFLLPHLTGRQCNWPRLGQVDQPARGCLKGKAAHANVSLWPEAQCRAAALAWPKPSPHKLHAELLRFRLRHSWNSYTSQHTDQNCANGCKRHFIKLTLRWFLCCGKIAQQFFFLVQSCDFGVKEHSNVLCSWCTIGCLLKVVECKLALSTFSFLVMAIVVWSCVGSGCAWRASDKKMRLHRDKNLDPSHVCVVRRPPKVLVIRLLCAILNVNGQPHKADYFSKSSSSLSEHLLPKFRIYAPKSASFYGFRWVNKGWIYLLDT